jgi:predicted MPP superfamily phosphohydrolase
MRESWQAGFVDIQPAAVGWALLRALPRWILRIALPLLFVGAILHSLPYRTTVQGVPLRVEATVFTRPGLSADSTVGNWEFPAVDGLPFGVHLSPENVDLLRLSSAAAPDPAQFAARLQAGLREEVPYIVAWLIAETLIGVALGLAASALINMGVRYLRGLPRRPDEVRHRLRQLGAAGGVLVAVAGYGAITYNSDWVHRSRLTGTLAAAQLFPNQLSTYYAQGSKVYDVLGSVTGIQAALQDQIEQSRLPDTAVRIMFISDVHLASVYPLVAQYAKNYSVDLIVNTGDESEFGTAAELTPAFTSAIAAVTAVTPMLWLAGNHDSPEVQAVMAAIPGVTVLGSKQATNDGYSVTAGVVKAFGLTIAGVPDPRVYGAAGAYGSDDAKLVDALEQRAVDTALTAAKKTDQAFDIFATHEPVAAAQLRHDLGDRIRQTNAGHTHAQNASGELQHGDHIDLVEGSTGAGGLDNIVRGANRPPIEFSIESVAPNCEFTRAVRFQIRTPDTPTGSGPAAYGDNVTASTVYFSPQKLPSGRVCSRSLGVGNAQRL